MGALIQSFNAVFFFFSVWLDIVDMMFHFFMKNKKARPNFFFPLPFCLCIYTLQENIEYSFVYITLNVKQTNKTFIKQGNLKETLNSGKVFVDLVWTKLPSHFQDGCSKVLTRYIYMKIFEFKRNIPKRTLNHQPKKDIRATVRWWAM